MAKLVWDATGSRRFETGIDQVALYVMENNTYGTGVAWNGVTGISESPDGGDTTDFWADNIKYASMRAAEKFGGSITAYTYPEKFEECDGSAELANGMYIGEQTRKKFGLVYRTIVGTDANSKAGHKYHIIYGCSVSPSERSYSTVNDSPDAIEFSWDFDSTAITETVGSDTYSTSHVIIDGTKLSANAVAALEELLYGGTGTAKMPTLTELKTAVSTSGT